MVSKVWGKHILSRGDGVSATEEGLFGAEIELEAVGDRTYPSISWSRTIDSSLKLGGSYEFVSKQPLPEAVLAESLSHLHMTLSKASPLPNQFDRAGIHIHSNICNMTYDQIQLVVCVMLLCEKLLFSFAPPNREQNIFCCPIYKSWRQQELVHRLMGYIYQIMEHGRDLNFSDKFWRHYGDTFNSKKNYYSINFGSMFTHGTIETRIFPSSNNLDDWLLPLYLAATFINAKKHIELKDLLTRQSAATAIRKLFREEIGDDSFLLEKDIIYKSIDLAWGYTWLIMKQSFVNPNTQLSVSPLVPPGQKSLAYFVERVITNHMDLLKEGA